MSVPPSPVCHTRSAARGQPQFWLQARSQPWEMTPKNPVFGLENGPKPPILVALAAGFDP